MTDALRSPPDRSEIFSRYLELVGRCQGSIKGASGGLIVSVDVTGKVNYVVVEDLREWRLQLEKFHSLYLQRHIERQHQYERQRSHSYSELEREGYSL